MDLRLNSSELTSEVANGSDRVIALLDIHMVRVSTKRVAFIFSLSVFLSSALQV